MKLRYVEKDVHHLLFVVCDLSIISIIWEHEFEHPLQGPGIDELTINQGIGTVSLPHQLAVLSTRHL